MYVWSMCLENETRHHTNNTPNTEFQHAMQIMRSNGSAGL